MLLTFSEALVLFHSSLRRGYCTISTNAHNSSTGPLYSSGKLGLVLLRALALSYLRYRPVLSAAPHSHHERCMLLHTRIVQLQFWMSAYQLLLISLNAPLSDQEHWCPIGYFAIGLSIPPFGPSPPQSDSRSIPFGVFWGGSQSISPRRDMIRVSYALSIVHHSAHPAAGICL